MTNAKQCGNALAFAQFSIQRAILISASEGVAVKIGVAATPSNVGRSIGVLCDVLRQVGGIHHEGLWTGGIHGHRWAVELVPMPIGEA
jgi:hypothetical protein